MKFVLEGQVTSYSTWTISPTIIVNKYNKLNKYIIFYTRITF